MLMPRRVKHRKQHRGRMTGQAKGGTEVTFGDYGIQALEPGWISARQIEAARIAMTRHVRRGGKVWIRIFPDKPVTKKPAETRMGSGKGNPEFWVAVVKPGRVLFELSYPNEDVARAAIERAIQKLPIKARVRRPGRPGSRGGLSMASKTAELRNMDTEELETRLDDAAAGAVQPALPAGHRPAGQQRPDRAGAPPGGPHGDDPARARDRRGRSGRGACVMAQEPEAAETTGRHNGRKVREGIVSSTSMDKTAIVMIVSRVRHPLYRKTLQRTSKLYVHDQGNECRPGDRVRVQETRPLSKLKRWRLLEIVERAK